MGSSGSGGGSSSGGGTATGNFSVQNGQIIDPNGCPWRAYGVGVFGESDVFPIAVTGGGATLAQQIRSLMPKINIVRIASYTNWFLSHVPSDYAAFTNDMTNAGVVVVFEHHDTDHRVLDATTSPTLAQESAWYASMASYYINNPLVMFQSMNSSG